MQSILGIDAINLRGGGIIHLKNILKTKNFYFNKIVVYGNNEILSQIKNNKVIKIYNKVYNKNLFYRTLWKLLFFKKKIIQDKINCMYYPDGIFYKKNCTSAIFIQNFLPFDKKVLKKYSVLEKIKYFLQKRMYIFSFKRSELIIFPSKYVKKCITNDYPFIKNKSVVIYHGANDRFLKKKKLKKKYLFSIYPASFEKFKNHKILINSFSNLKEKNFFLDFYGPGKISQLKKIKYLIKNNPMINYRGIKSFRSNYIDYDLLIYPSMCESFGLPLVEAARSGVKIICSNLPVFREILGSYPLYFNPNSKKSIINNLLKVDKLKINQKTVANFKKKYCWKKCSDMTFRKIYNISLNEKKNFNSSP